MALGWMWESKMGEVLCHCCSVLASTTPTQGHPSAQEPWGTSYWEVWVWDEVPVTHQCLGGQLRNLITWESRLWCWMD